MRLELWRDDAAWTRLAAPGFREQWERLYADCPWASVFQSHAYVTTWYDVYRPQYTPLIVGAVGDDGTLAGLLSLAIDRKGDQIVAGGRHAEYQVWLARPEQGDAFIEAALERLAAESRGGTLTFRYLPPTAPRRWLASRRGLAARCVLVPVRHGMMAITEDTVKAALKRKSYRHRLRRMERLGLVAYQRVTDPHEVDAVLDEIMPLCDIRHGAIHGVMPFTDDPLKAAFYRALARVPGLLYVSVLRCGEEIVGAGVDADNRGAVALGFAAFSPAFSRLAPRRLQLTALVNDLRERGYASLDLTPGDDSFKREWATRFEEAYTLDVFLSRSRYMMRKTVGGVRRTAKTMLQRIGADPDRLSERVESWARELSAAGARHAPIIAGQALRRYLWSSDALEVYRFVGDPAVALPPGGPMVRDRISDLVAYRRGVFTHEAREVFLLSAYRRLEHGTHVFTHVEAGQLAACGWVKGPPDSDDGDDSETVLSRAADSAVVHDVRIGPRSELSGDRARVLGQLIREGAQLKGATHVLFAVARDDSELRRVAVQLGGRHTGTIYRRWRLGRTKVTSTLASNGETAASAEVPEAASPRVQAAPLVAEPTSPLRAEAHG